MNCPCGYDPRLFKLLKEQFAEKSVLQLHGIILLDEMSTRRNLLLDTKTVSYKGLEDYGDNQLKDADQEMADHGLVIMFQPLYDNYSQPIAVFASKGTVSGTNSRPSRCTLGTSRYKSAWNRGRWRET